MPALNLKPLFERLKLASTPKEVVAFDFTRISVKCARMRKTDAGVHLLALDVLPRTSGENGAGPEMASSRKIAVPGHLMCRHALLSLPGTSALVKLLSLPGNLDADSEAKIREDMGISGTDFRVGYKILGHSHGRVETKLLTVALPEDDFQRCLGYFSTGWPVPVSVEVAGVAAINAFIGGYLDKSDAESFGVIQIEEDVSFFAFVHKKELVLIRKYDFGDEHILGAIQSRLNVNRETALNVAADRSFDVSQMIKEVCDPFIRQVVISKRFVERRENCRVGKIYIPESASASYRMSEELRVASESEIESWDPLKWITFQQGAIPPKYETSHSLFAAAIGMGLGFFREQTEGELK